VTSKRREKKEYQHQWYEANKQRVGDKRKALYGSRKDHEASLRLKSKFGITLDEYDKMFAQQGGRCAICGSKPNVYDKNGNLRRIAVDHDHKTGRVRQLLCSPCNTSIGLVKENV